MSDPRTIEARARRLLSVWEASGRGVGALEITADGTVRILAPDSAARLPSPPEGQNTCDTLFGTGSD